ncbi:mediator of RNA polymerase II transcription subunit 25-like isoform X2 [Solanum dulcamara]|uniref:mediator of RNA polymerase II transcription subunit 25-like isoform X2 n=1 Tax=Solanum dulcamara TaxID=45834 RepID=UPI0024860898|nr:mediator of RNA polymerase II transcription subunit 25-like isoform X2 [Solanum dulcamara]
MLQRSGWTRNIDVFFQWLSALPFSGGGFNDVAAAEGLASALMMFSSFNGSQQAQQNADGQRHCILVAASNPYPLPTPVYYPAMLNLEQSGNIEAHTSLRLADAEIVAKAFPQCSVSLSVICPRKLPKLRAIYNAGKHDPQAADPPVDASKNPNFLVLISENFSRDCAAFSHTEMESLAPNQSLVEMDMTSVPPISGPANSSVMNQQPISAGNIPAAPEPAMATSVGRPAPPHIPTAHPTSQVAASLQSGLPISISEEMVPNNENTKETTPIVSVMTQSLSLPFSGAAANVGILNEVASAISTDPTVLTSGQLGFTSMTGFAPIARTDQISQNFGPASLTLMAPSIFGNSNHCMSQPLSNILGGTGAGSQTVPVMSRVNLPGSQMMQSGIGMHQNVPSGTGIGMPSGQLLSKIPGAIGAGSPTAHVMSQGNLPGSQMMQSRVGMHQNVPSGMDTSMPLGQLLSNIQGVIGEGNLTVPVMSRGNLPGRQMMQSGIGMHRNVPTGMHTGMPSGQLLSNIQGGIDAGSLAAPVMSQGNFPGSQMMPRGIGMHQNVPSGMGSSMPLEIGRMMPTPGMTQQGEPGILALGRNNSAEANMSLSQQQTMATSPSAQSGYVKIWETQLCKYHIQVSSINSWEKCSCKGNLSIVKRHEPEHISRLQGYKRSSASESLAANLPQTLQILHIARKDHMIEQVRQHTGKADILVFWAIEEHELLNHLQEMNMGGIISLPSHTLFLYVSDKTYRLIGMLLPYENMEFRPSIPNQQLQEQLSPQVEQLLEQPITGARYQEFLEFNSSSG